MRVNCAWVFLAAMVASLSVAACELVAGVHDVSLGQVAGGTGGGGGEAGPDAPSEVGAGACAHEAGSGNVYYVDPTDGDDTNGTGATPACAFRTITRAIKVVGPGAQPGTTIQIARPGEVMGSQEAFPIVVPANVTIAGWIGTTVLVPASPFGFELSGAGAGLSDLIIDGNAQANEGVRVDSTDEGAPPWLADVEVRNMGGNGIHVLSSATLVIHAAVSSHDNGRMTHPVLPNIPSTSGLFIEGAVTISVNAGEIPARFDDNTLYGIVVYGTGSLTMSGDAGTVAQAEGNAYDGLLILQTPGAHAPLNTIEGLLAQSNHSMGIQVLGGSSLKLRRSQTKGNVGYGMYVRVNTFTGGPASNDITGIDLGTPADPGGNTFQYTDTDTIDVNRDCGLCLNLWVDAGPQTLQAAGNVFEGADCADAGVSLTRAIGCSGGYDVCTTNANPPNTIDLSQCQ
jgi:hypothetical protein